MAIFQFGKCKFEVLGCSRVNSKSSPFPHKVEEGDVSYVAKVNFEPTFPTTNNLETCIV